MNQEIFVFGSNLAGKHGAGAAAYAAKHCGAVYGVGVGPMNGAYAIPTKDCQLQTLPRTIVALYVAQFINYATMCWDHPDMMNATFKVTRIGCGLAGYADKEIAPLFDDAPANCYFDEAWKDWLRNPHKYWGTYNATT